MGIFFEMLFMAALTIIASILVSFLLIKLFQGLFGSRVACVIAGVLMLFIIIILVSSSEGYISFPSKEHQIQDAWSTMVLFPSIAVVMGLTLLVTMEDGLWAAMVAVFKYSMIVCVVATLIFTEFKFMGVGYIVTILGVVGLVWAWIRNE